MVDKELGKLEVSTWNMLKWEGYSKANGDGKALSSIIANYY